MGSLIAAGTVVVMAATFTTPSFHRLPLEDDVSATGICSSSAAAGADASVETSSGHQHGHHGVVESMYGSHVVPSHHHVIWAPTPARQSLPPPPPPPY